MKAQIPKSVKKYEKKYFGFAKVQLTFIIIGFAIGGVAAYFFSNIMPFEFAMLASALIAVLFMIIGFINVSGLNAFQIAKMIISEALWNAGYSPYRIGGFNHEKEK